MGQEENTSDDSGTGPQGTRVFRREDINKHFAELDAQSGAADGKASGATLTGLNGAYKGKRFDLPTGRSTLGRDNQNDIIIDADSISLVHARLVEKEGRYRVLNLLSTNGTWVNDKKVSDTVLKNGDTICFGEAEFIFQQPEKTDSGLLAKLRRWLGRAG